MKLEKIAYSDLNSKQQENYNFHKVAALLADYGYNCIKLSDDWQGADFLAYHPDDGKTLRVQLKGRATINQKYMEKNLYMALPIKDQWFLVEHDKLVEAIRQNTKWLATESWTVRGGYASRSPNKKLLSALSGNIISPVGKTRDRS